MNRISPNSSKYSALCCKGQAGLIASIKTVSGSPVRPCTPHSNCPDNTYLQYMSKFSTANFFESLQLLSSTSLPLFGAIGGRTAKMTAARATTL